jgi:hypothetical protein
MKSILKIFGGVILLSIPLVTLVMLATRVDAQGDLSAKIAAAKTAADHEAIAAELDQEAKDLETKAVLHADMAKHYAMDQYAHTPKPNLQKHCEDLSANLKKAAGQAREMAKLHRGLAQKAAK